MESLLIWKGIQYCGAKRELTESMQHWRDDLEGHDLAEDNTRHANLEAAS